jgi:tyrosyl-tRNA synthetase
MAREVVAGFHSMGEAEGAQEAFIRQFSQRQLPADIPLVSLSTPQDIVEFMVNHGLAVSKNKARELIRQGGVSWYPRGEDGSAERIAVPEFIVEPMEGAIIKVGKRQYVRLKID